MATQTTSTILNSAISSSQQLITQYAFSEDLGQDLVTAFGASYDSDAATDLIEQWQTGEFGAFPEFEIRSSEELNGANGAFSADTNKIYISEEYLFANANNFEAISNLVLEEYGHFVDAKINIVDAAGDEGEIFAGLVRGKSFSDRELRQLKLENDKAVVNIDGQDIAIEQQSSINNLPENLKIKGKKFNLHVGDFNGDGRDDFLANKNGDKSSRIFFADENGNFSTSKQITLPKNLKIKGNKFNLHVGDFNGDGRDDFLAQQKEDKNKDSARIFFADKNGDFSTSKQITLPENLKINGHEHKLHIGDFDGDGRDDILAQQKDDRVSRIFFADKNGNFSTSNMEKLPEDFEFRTSRTTLHIGDFDGDGIDDFLRHKKQKSGPENTIFFSKGDGTFKKTLVIEDVLPEAEKPENILEDLQEGESNTSMQLSIGDFNGDGVDDFLPRHIRRKQQPVVVAPGDFTESRIISDSDRIHFLDANNNVSTGRSGVLEPLVRSQFVDESRFSIGDFNGDGNDDILSNQKDAKITRISLTQNFDITGGTGDNILAGGGSEDTLSGGDGNDSLVGGGGNDFLDGGDGNSTLVGGLGDDTLVGGNGFTVAQYQGGLDEFNLFIEQDENITIEDLNLSANGNEGVDTLINIDRLTFGDNSIVDFAFGDANNNVLTGSSNIDSLFGGQGEDLLTGEGNNDRLVGGENNDTLRGGEGNDILEGGEGNDILDGGDGIVDIASYQGKFDGFDITFNEDRSITVEDIDTADGDEGTDTLTNISLLSFGGTNFAGDTRTSNVKAIAGVSSEKTTTSIAGGKADATNFIIDIEGSTGLTLDFNNQQLADFINDITLPDQGIENERLVANLGFDVLGGALGAIPIIGNASATGVAIAQTLANYKFDLAQVDAQIDAAGTAVREFDPLNFGDIVETIRDTVVIDDFQIGVDNLILPSITGLDGGYSLVKREFGGKSGVSIEAIQNGKKSELVFIANGYESLSLDEFETQISNLLSSQEGPGTVLSTFNQTPQLAKVDPTGAARANGTFAGDYIFGEKLTIPSDSNRAGDHVIDGEFGDDLLQGNVGNDILHGGFIGDGGRFVDPATGERSLEDGIFTYQDDGFDTLQGGLGDDTLFGGSGNDVLDGGGFTFNEGDITATGVLITEDGADRLIGGSGNDTFVFNALSTDIDIIEDFTVRVDKIRIDSEGFGATDISQFSFDNTSGALSFNSQQFATLENFASLQGFDVNADIQLVGLDTQLV